MNVVVLIVMRQYTAHVCKESILSLEIYFGICLIYMTCYLIKQKEKDMKLRSVINDFRFFEKLILVKRIWMCFIYSC